MRGRGGLAGLVAGLATALASFGCGSAAPPRGPSGPPTVREAVPGPVRLLGSGHSACTNGVVPDGQGDRWCVFARRGATPDATELWVFNLNAVARGGTCDASGPHCRRLTENLWTGGVLLGPTHPWSHAFEGDTLFFHADSTAPQDGFYRGPVWAWRPGWVEARRITSERGLMCFGHHRAAVAMCIEDPVIVIEEFFRSGRPHEFDVTAGPLVDREDTALAKIDRVLAFRGTALAWQAAFSPRGETFALSSIPPGGSRETLRVVATADAGKTPPRIILADAARWQIANDGRKVYFLAGYPYRDRSNDSGTLRMADFPSGAGAVPLHDGVIGFTRLGNHDDFFGDRDLGLGIFLDSGMQRPAFKLMPDRAAPTRLVDFDVGIDKVLVSIDLRHTLFVRSSAGRDFAAVSRSDGSGECGLNVSTRSAFSGHFSDRGRRVFWLEFGADDYHQGWAADPADCGRKTKFTDAASFYEPVGDSLVLFGEEDRGGSPDVALRLARFGADPGALEVTTVMANVPREPAVVRTGPTTAYVVFQPDDAHGAGSIQVYGPLAIE